MAGKIRRFLTQKGEPNAAGRRLLRRLVTDPKGQVYAFTSKADPIKVAATMARLSRSPNDARVIYLGEFAESELQGSEMMSRVITEFGDDSVQQLAGIYVVVEGVSNLVIKLVEWGRLAAYLEQSTRYIFFDVVGPDGRYRIYVPVNLTADVAEQYDNSLQEIVRIYSDMVRRLTEHVRTHRPRRQDETQNAWNAATRAQACDAARVVLPAAIRSTVGIFASAQAVENMIMRLQAEDLVEAQQVGQDMLKQVRQVSPTFFERADDPKYGLARSAYWAANRQAMFEIAGKLDSSQPDTSEGIQLLDYFPKNELELVPHVLFSYTDLSTEQIAQQVAGWTEEEQREVLRKYCGQRLNRRQKPGRGLEYGHVWLEFDAKDFGTFRDIQRQRMVDSLEWQRLTVQFGHIDPPQLIQDAGLVDEFEQCFSISEELYRFLWEEGFVEESQYATLLGHKMRYRIGFNIRELFHVIELRTQLSGHPGYRKIFQEVHEIIRSIWPTIASMMVFVNQGENDDLTRIGAELATDFRLSRIGAARDNQE